LIHYTAKETTERWGNGEREGVRVFAPDIMHYAYVFDLTSDVFE
jgi:hypothetical protein